MIAFATSMIGHWYGGLGLAGVVACALFAAISGSSVATVVGIGSIILPGNRAERLSAPLRRRRDRDLGRARHPVPALDQSRHLRGGDERHAAQGAGRRDRRLGVRRTAVHRRSRARADAGHHARRDHLVPRLAQRLSAHAAGELGETLRAFRESFWGLFLIVLRARRHLCRPVHADRGRRDGGRLRLLHRRLRL